MAMLTMITMPITMNRLSSVRVPLFGFFSRGVGGGGEGR